MHHSSKCFVYFCCDFATFKLQLMYRLPFTLDELSLRVIENKMKELKIDDLNAYFDKAISQAMAEANFKNCTPEKCIIDRKKFNKLVNKKRSDFIECIAAKHSTTKSNVVKTLLLTYGSDISLLG